MASGEEKAIAGQSHADTPAAITEQYWESGKGVGSVQALS